MTADTTWNDCTDATDAEFAEVLAKIEAAPAAAESFDATAALRRVLALADEIDGLGVLDSSGIAADIRAAVAGEP